MLTYFANLHKNNSFAIIDMEREERQEKEGANKRASRMNGEWREKNRDGQQTPNYPQKKEHSL